MRLLGGGHLIKFYGPILSGPRKNFTPINVGPLNKNLLLKTIGGPILSRPEDKMRPFVLSSSGPKFYWKGICSCPNKMLQFILSGLLRAFTLKSLDLNKCTLLRSLTNFSCLGLEDPNSFYRSQSISLYPDLLFPIGYVVEIVRPIDVKEK